MEKGWSTFNAGQGHGIPKFQYTRTTTRPEDGYTKVTVETVTIWCSSEKYFHYLLKKWNAQGLLDNEFKIKHVYEACKTIGETTPLTFGNE